MSFRLSKSKSSVRATTTTTTTPLIDVYVKLPSGRTSVQNLQKTIGVKKIYQNVAEEEGIDVERIRIKYMGKVLKKSDTIGYLGICKETVLKAEIISIKNIGVVIKTKEGNNFMISVKNIDTVSTLKTLIYKNEGIETSKQCLKYGGRTLEDHQTVLDAGLTEEACIDLLEKLETTPLAAEAHPEEASDETKEAVLNSFTSDGRPVEVVFSFDTTGSMYSCLTEVRSKLRDTCSRLLRDIANVRIGLIAHGDYCDHADKYVLRSVDLTRDVDTLTDFAQNVPSTSGGDTPECYEWVLRKSQQLDWSENSAKALVVIGDCEPHPPSMTDQAIFWKDEADLLAGMGIKIYGVQAQVNHIAQNFYEELADRTGGCYINFKNFDLITDMFLAVCYKESSADQLEAYVEEVRQEGLMTEEKQAMFTQLEEKKTPDNKTQDEKPSRYVKQAWWDPTLDRTATPSYEYLANENKWQHYNRPTIQTESRPPVVHSTPVVHSSIKRRCSLRLGVKKGCEIM